MQNNIFSINQLKQEAVNQRYGDKGIVWKILLHVLKRVQDFIPDENVIFVYPKKLLGNDKDKAWDGTNLEVVLFTRNSKIIIAKTIEEAKRVQINFYKKSDITSITLKSCLTDYKTQIKYEVVIGFKDGGKLVLNCKDDANEYWEEDYSEAIAKIIQFLIK